MDYLEFSVASALDRKTYLCRFRNLMTGISLRHSDTVDVQFLVNGKGVTIALPHAAFAEYRRQTGLALTDADAIQIASNFLKELLEKGDPTEEPLLTPSPQQTLELIRKLPAPARQ